MSQDKNMLQVLEKLGDIAERTARIETKCETMEKDIDWIKEEDRKQNNLLDAHILGVRTNTERLELEKAYRMELDARVSNLEKVPNFLSSLKKIATWVGAVLAPVSILLGIYYSWLKLTGQL